jgi:hypothetical protein
MENWRKVWREGFASVLPTAGLKALRKALISDDTNLIQGATTLPPPLECNLDLPIDAACAVCLAVWKGDDVDDKTIREVEEQFAATCFDVDARVGEAAGCRWFLNWFDDTPRDKMRRVLLAEVDLVLKDRDFEFVNELAMTT